MRKHENLVKEEHFAPNSERQAPVPAKVFIPADRMAAALRHLIPGVIARLEREAQEEAHQGTG